MDYIEIGEGRKQGGMRLVLTAGIPGPWSEGAKALFEVKGIDYVAVRQVPGQSDDELLEWTAQTSAPVAVWENERPRSSWVEILYLAERLAPEPPLIPERSDDRIKMFWLLHEVAGDRGFGWQRRLMLVHPALQSGGGQGLPALLGEKYGYSKEAGEAAPEGCIEILRTLSDQLAEQRERGSRFFIGDALSALDLYWATFAALVEPLPAELCPMDDGMRAAYTLVDPVVAKAVDPLLLEHRKFVYENYLTLPVPL